MTAPLKRPRRKPGSVKTIDAKVLEELQAGFDKLLRWDEPPTIQLIGLTAPQRDALKAKYKRQWAIWNALPFPTEFEHVPNDPWTVWWLEVNERLNISQDKVINVGVLDPHIDHAACAWYHYAVITGGSDTDVVSKVFFERQCQEHFNQIPTLRPRDYGYRHETHRTYKPAF